jgi:catechol 2,3-dioxygenase-like lactoylglutathione lyase family enzyme
MLTSEWIDPTQRNLGLSRHIRIWIAPLAALLVCAGVAQAQPVFDEAARRTVVESAAEALRSRYVFPDVGENAAVALEAALAAGEYDDVPDAAAFAQRLTADLMAVANDKHLRVSAFGQPMGDPGAAPPPRNENGVARADRLVGNVGYLEIVGFPPLEAFQAPFDRAMAALRETRALIIDARRHGGGTPVSEAYLASYFVEAGQRVAVNKFITRIAGTATFRTQEFFTSPTPFSYAGKPVIVLTSGFTFSGGEALAYDLRALGLARVIGETTGGGAHPGGMIGVGAGFAMFLPSGRGENPTTGTNWQNVGVIPDIATPAADALKVALEELGESPQTANVDELSEARLFEPAAMPQLAGGPQPTGLVVGSGHYYSPIVDDLAEAVAFYRDGLGFEVQGEPSTADEDPQLRALFGLPEARLRLQVALAPAGPASRSAGVEIVEISEADGRRVARDMQDPGAVMLMVVMRDIDEPLARLKQLGAPVVTTGGSPVTVGGGPQGLVAVVVKDPAGHFVELLELGALPQAPVGSNSNIIAVRVRHTVENLEHSLALYRDALGLRGGPQVPPYAGAPEILDLLGLTHEVQYRFTILTVPTSGLGIELIEFKDARRPAEAARIADPGSTRLQFVVADVDAAVAAVTNAGGAFVSMGGLPLDMPTGDSTRKVGIVRDADGLFIELIQAPPLTR